MLTDKELISINGKEIEVSHGTTYLEISKMLENKYKRKPIIVNVNGKYKELSHVAKDGDKAYFCDLTDKIANRVYLNGLVFLTKYAFNELFHGKNSIMVKHSADKALCIQTVNKITKEDVVELEKKMHLLVEANLPINKVMVLKTEALDYFDKVGDIKKRKLLEYVHGSYIELYKIGNMYNYIYGKVPSETSCLDEFKLTFVNNNTFALQFPTVYINDHIKDYQHHEKLFEEFDRAKQWGHMIHVETCSDLNKVVSAGHMGYLIRISETLFNNRLIEIAQDICFNRKVKVVLISGPSSSGKTTTCTKLTMYLHSFGMIPKMISMDNFFKERVDTPKKPNGEYDFECLEAVDLKLFNKTIGGLLEGKTVKMPEFDFYSGEKKFKKEMTLGENEILVIEGIHALNPKLLNEIDNDKKYRIYLSPLSSVNLDNDNRISTTDNRLLRRMIRDNRTRGYNISQTLSIWDDVREGEEKYVFPYQDEADIVINTSLIYEFCVLNTYVLPLLYAVPEDDPNFGEALRLRKVLNAFLPAPSEAIPDDSILREFIGGSCF